MRPASKDRPDTWQWVAWNDFKEMRPRTGRQALARLAIAQAVGKSDFIEYLRWLNVYLHEAQ